MSIIIPTLAQSTLASCSRSPTTRMLARLSSAIYWHADALVAKYKKITNMHEKLLFIIWSLIVQAKPVCLIDPGCKSPRVHRRQVAGSRFFIRCFLSIVNTNIDFIDVYCSWHGCYHYCQHGCLFRLWPHVPAWIIVSQDGDSVERLKTKLDESSCHW